MFSFNSTAVSADKNVLRDHFAEHVFLGIDIETALAFTLADATAEIARKVTGGAGPFDSLRALGIPSEKADTITVKIREIGYSHGDLSYPVLRAAIAGTDVVVIPTAECIHSHLQKGTKPSREEIQKAWDACMKK